jgi:sulfide dehydrogenase [flavocytochrome c] flavoprotein subunit
MRCSDLSRRQVLAGLALLALWRSAGAGVSARVVVVGGGFAGAAAARLLKLAEPQLDVTLIEPKAQFHSCPMSNAVIVGLRSLDSIAWDYRGLAALGVRHRRQSARDIDVVGQRLQLDDGQWLAWDRLILAPGIALRFDAIEGHSAALAERFPHAWQGGAQTTLLRRQLSALADGTLVLLSVPDNPYRCPPGPYERASLIGHYLKQHKPRSKLLILDGKDSFSKQALFQQGWQRHCPGIIEWLGRSADGAVRRVDARGEVECEFGSRHRAALLNLIPPQRAGEIAVRAGLTDASGWVPVLAPSFRSVQTAQVQVIGDACIAAPMPKSAYSAHAQARAAVAALLAELRGEPAPVAALDNSCYSLLAPGRAVSIAARYQALDGHLSEVPGSLQLSPLTGAASLRAQEAAAAEAWYQSIGRATWGLPE